MLKAIKEGDHLIATELYNFKIPNDIRYRAFQVACVFERFSIVENFIQHGADPLFLGDAFLTAVCNGNLSQVNFLSRFSIDKDWVDVALELSAVEGNEDLFEIILLCSPSIRGLVKSLMNAASFDREVILDLLFHYAIFSNQQINVFGLNRQKDIVRLSVKGEKSFFLPFPIALSLIF